MKKWIAIVLCVVMALSMAACGEKDNGETTAPSVPGETTAPQMQTPETTAPQETEDPGYDPSWADELDNEAASQISDPALRGWEDFTIETEIVLEDGSKAVKVVGYPAGNAVDDSNRYSVCTEVREEAEALADEMRYCGFTLNEVVTDAGEVQMDKETWIPGDYSFQAENANGYRCTIQVTSGQAEILVTVEKIPAEVTE